MPVSEQVALVPGITANEEEGSPLTRKSLYATDNNPAALSESHDTERGTPPPLEMPVLAPREEARGRGGVLECD